MATSQVLKDLTAVLQLATGTAGKLDRVYLDVRGYLTGKTEKPNWDATKKLLEDARNDLTALEAERKGAKTQIDTYSKNWAKKGLKGALQPKVAQNRKDLEALWNDTRGMQIRLDTLVDSCAKLVEQAEDKFLTDFKS